MPAARAFAMFGDMFLRIFLHLCLRLHDQQQGLPCAARTLTDSAETAMPAGFHNLVTVSDLQRTWLQAEFGVRPNRAPAASISPASRFPVRTVWTNAVAFLARAAAIWCCYLVLRVAHHLAGHAEQVPSRHRVTRPTRRTAGGWRSCMSAGCCAGRISRRRG
jgi:hypothetical protein